MSTQLGTKVVINPRTKEKELDIKNPKERYQVKYVPPGGPTFISPITSMKYNLSKQQLKLQGQFTQRLKEAILENQEQSNSPIKVTKYYCSGCDGLLFSENEILNHVPVYNSQHMANRQL